MHKLKSSVVIQYAPICVLMVLWLMIVIW